VKDYPTQNTTAWLDYLPNRGGSTPLRGDTMETVEGSVIPQEPETHVESEARGEKAARIRAGLKQFAHLKASSESFLREKWAELDAEREQRQRDTPS
jgi:hypothetical protein